MKKTRPERMIHSWRRTWSLMTLAFAGILLGSFTLDYDAADAQETKAKAKAKNPEFTPKSKNLPIAQSLTQGKTIDSAALARLIDQEINKRIKADKDSNPPWRATVRFRSPSWPAHSRTPHLRQHRYPNPKGQGLSEQSGRSVLPPQRPGYCRPR